uniref:Uncharacterized protein n=1 Tax=Anguilla anguilla TaxID=7936 RepID=A0A0E9PV43_ANGAN
MQGIARGRTAGAREWPWPLAFKANRWCYEAVQNTSCPNSEGGGGGCSILKAKC